MYDKNLERPFAYSAGTEAINVAFYRRLSSSEDKTTRRYDGTKWFSRTRYRLDVRSILTPSARLSAENTGRHLQYSRITLDSCDATVYLLLPWTFDKYDTTFRKSTWYCSFGRFTFCPADFAGFPTVRPRSAVSKIILAKKKKKNTFESTIYKCPYYVKMYLFLFFFFFLQTITSTEFSPETFFTSRSWTGFQTSTYYVHIIFRHFVNPTL